MAVELLSNGINNVSDINYLINKHNADFTTIRCGNSPKNSLSDD